MIHDTSSSNVTNGTGGTIAGHVSAVDSLLYLSDPSGFTVSIPGLTSTTTDNTGYWKLDNIPSGIYDIIVTKPGYGTYKYIAQQFVGDATLYLSGITLVTLPTFTPHLDTVYFTDQDPRYLEISASTPPQPNPNIPNQAVFEIDTNQNFAHEVLVKNNFAGPSTPSSNTIMFGVPISYFTNNYHTHSGTTLYIRVGAVRAGFYPFTTTYYDSRLDRTFYTTLGDTTSTVTVTLP